MTTGAPSAPPLPNSAATPSGTQQTNEKAAQMAALISQVKKANEAYAGQNPNRVNDLPSAATPTNPAAQMENSARPPGYAMNGNGGMTALPEGGEVGMTTGAPSAPPLPNSAATPSGTQQTNEKAAQERAAYDQFVAGIWPSLPKSMPGEEKTAAARTLFRATPVEQRLIISDLRARYG